MIHKLFIAVASVLMISKLVGAAEQPDMVVYLSDDPSQFDSCLYGNANIPTPELERLAADGMTLTHAFELYDFVKDFGEQQDLSDAMPSTATAMKKHLRGWLASVDEVVRHNPVSRSTLERQVRKYLRRSHQEEIRFVQVKRVRVLLLTTDLSAKRIAGTCGFEHPGYLHVVIKRVTGMTPGKFRREANP